MYFTKKAIAGLSLLAISATASQVQVNNYCWEQHWITEINGTWNSNGSWALDSGVAYLTDVVGQGNSLGVTKENTYWVEGTPKLILGYSTSEGELWWSVSSYDGEPYDSKQVNVTSPSGEKPNACGEAVGYEAKNHNCLDNNVTLTLNLCAQT